MKKKNELKIWIAAAVFMTLLVTSVLAVLAIGIVGVSASGPTYVSGIISSDTTWTVANSPYIVTGSILVEEGVTLTIEPDVVVKFNSEKGLQIDGELIAQGTEAEPIVFTSNQPSTEPGDWVNIVFTDSSVDATYDEEGIYINGSIMQCCIVEYGGGSDTPTLKIVSSSLFIDHCNIKNNGYHGVYAYGGSLKISNSTITDNSGRGIYTNFATVTISRNIICDNSAYEGGGIVCVDGSTATISDNIISNNSASWLGGGINAGYYGGATTIINNTISNNSASAGGGVSAYHGTTTIINNTIGNNSASVGGGVYASSGTATIRGNTITHNSASDNGAGICISSGTVSISYNEITGNSITQGDGKGGGIFIYWQPVINYNNIHNNTPYDVYNSNEQGSPHVNATYNWWGTTDEAIIQAHIYDWYDNATRGIVDYIPYLTEPVTPENIPPIASFTFSPENPVVAQTITFNASNSTDPDGNITSYEWDFGDGNNTNTTEPITTYSYASAGTYNVNLTVTDDDGAPNPTSKLITVSELERFIFDTKAPANPYPSIMGNHTGTIKPNHTVIAAKLYTYSCIGTGGHTEYARICNKTWNATATWKGYTGDWHNISFDKTVVLVENKTYNYTIRTGSYPQIHHTPELPTDNGWINCTEFIDANGKRYNNWVPAIRVW
jgi:PKD repeat protein